MRQTIRASGIQRLMAEKLARLAMGNVMPQVSAREKPFSQRVENKSGAV